MDFDEIWRAGNVHEHVKRHLHYPTLSLASFLNEKIQEFTSTADTTYLVLKF